MIRKGNNYYSLVKGFRTYNFTINGEVKMSTTSKANLLQYFKEKNLNFSNKFLKLKSYKTYMM